LRHKVFSPYHAVLSTQLALSQDAACSFLSASSVCPERNEGRSSALSASVVFLSSLAAGRSPPATSAKLCLRLHPCLPLLLIASLPANASTPPKPLGASRKPSAKRVFASPASAALSWKSWTTPSSISTWTRFSPARRKSTPTFTSSPSIAPSTCLRKKA